MSLNYDLTKIKNWETVCKDDGSLTINDTTESLVFLTMATDLNGITEKNLDEWLFRLQVMRLAHWGEAHRIVSLPLKDVYCILQKYVGLSTNVSTKTRTSWLKRVTVNLKYDAEHAVRIVMKEVSNGLHDSQ